jgi:dinuclear metal center YbgI/SA1388 family protein
MVNREELTAALDSLLAINSVPADKSNNGLQVEGSATVAHVVFAVDGSAALYAEAAAIGADYIFVHHGESWGAGWQRVTGRFAERLRLLLANDISLYGAHLPLDAHTELGHNACIAAALGVTECEPFAEYAGVAVGMRGRLATPTTVEALTAQVDAALDAAAAVYAFGPQPVQSVGIVSGAGASALDTCAALGIDCLITGECGHTDFHVMQELGVSLIAAGHYRTEVPGVRAVMAEVERTFQVRCSYVDLPTGL